MFFGVEAEEHLQHRGGSHEDTFIEGGSIDCSSWESTTGCGLYRHGQAKQHTKKKQVEHSRTQFESDSWAALFSASEAAPDVVGWLRLAEDEAWARAIPSGFVLIDGAALGAVAEPVWQFLWPFTATYSLDNTKFT